MSHERSKPGDPGPMVRRQQLGTALRRYRTGVGMSIKQVADRLLVAPSKISRIETAQRNATLRDVRDLCDLYGISDAAVREQLMELARESRERGWWQQAPLSPALKTLIGMEGSAHTIREFQILSIPGLLQVPEYAEAIVAAYFPDDSNLRRSVIDARIRRQEILTGDSPPVIDVVLDEAALRRMIGNRSIMRKQLTHVLELIDKLTVGVRVIPFSAGAHIGMDTGFSILEFSQPDLIFSDSAVPAVVYVETLEGATYWDQPAIVNKYLKAYETLANRSLTRDESRDFLTSVHGEL